MIPKIIHQSAPKNKKYWNPLWEKCQRSWRKNFSKREFKYILWSDDDNYDLVKNYYPQYLKLYTSFPYDIFRIDFCRFLYLHRYGGIYADMDMYCYRNFYSTLSDNIFLVESFHPKELVQNSLMISPENNEFWTICLEKILDYAIENNFNWKIPKFLDSNCSKNEDYQEFYDKIRNLVMTTTGPTFLSRQYAIYKDNLKIKKLQFSLFNPSDVDCYNYIENPIDNFNKVNSTKDSNIYTRHFVSNTWGVDYMKIKKVINDSILKS